MEPPAHKATLVQPVHKALLAQPVLLALSEPLAPKVQLALSAQLEPLALLAQLAQPAQKARLELSAQLVLPAQPALLAHRVSSFPPLSLFQRTCFGLTPMTRATQLFLPVAQRAKSLPRLQRPTMTLAG